MKYVIITSAKEIMYLVLFLCLFASYLDIWKAC